jgi:hypothetical protein
MTQYTLFVTQRLLAYGGALLVDNVLFFTVLFYPISTIV